MDDAIRTIALSLGLSWGSGLNLYGTVAMIGLLGATGQVILPEQLQELSEPKIIVGALVLYAIEFFADKIPIVDSIWDALHSFIRVPIGAILTSYAVGNSEPWVTWMAYILGGGISAVVHVGKAGTRVVANTSPEPYSNWFLSITEDIAVFAGIWSALHYPLAFIVFIVCFLTVLIWAIPKLFRFVLGDFVGLRLKIKPKHKPAPKPAS